MDKVRQHVSPYIIPSMRYKIELINKKNKIYYHFMPYWDQYLINC
jgi:hypothetical protein